jgi:hypothetical protein
MNTGRVRIVASAKLHDFADDRGSTIPLILGFFLIALVMVTGSVAASDAFTKQRDLQSLCDGVAIAAANAADPRALHSQGTSGSSALPLADVDGVIATYLSRDPSRVNVQVTGGIGDDGATVNLTCGQHPRVAFGTMFGFRDGINQTALASARSPLAP